VLAFARDRSETACRVNGCKTTHVGKVAEHLECFDKGLPLFAASFQIEAEDRPGAARQQFFGQPLVGVRLKHWIPDARYKCLPSQKLHHFFGVAHMPGHAQRQRLDALQYQPGRVRAHAGAEIAQAFAAGAQQKSADAALVAKHP
jgi:hypothetical protein